MLARESNKAFALSAAQRFDWLRLIGSENVGPRTFRTLINHYGGAKAALAALPALARRGGKTSVRVCSDVEAERELTETERIGVRSVALGEAEYPDAFQAINADHLGTAGAGLPSPQPLDLRPRSRRHRGRSGAPLRLAYHGPPRT